MQFPLPFILILTIPSGAGPGDPRVVIGDPAGSIGIFNSNGDLTGLLTSDGPDGSPGFFVFNPLDDDDYVALEAVAGFPGLTFADALASVSGRWSPGRTGTPGTTQQFTYDINTPRNFPAQGAELSFLSESDDQTIPPSFNFAATGSADAQLNLNGRRIGRGVLEGGYLEQNANDAARAAGVATNATVSPTEGLIGGDLYRVTMNAQANCTAGVVIAVALDYNGTNIRRLQRFSAAETPGGVIFINSSIDFVAPADDPTPVFTVENDAGSGGSITLLGNPIRTLTVEHLGEP